MIPSSPPRQQLTPLSEDFSVMPRKRLLSFVENALQEAVDSYEDSNHGNGLVGFFKSMMHGDGMDRRAILAVIAKRIPTAVESKAEDPEGKVIDFPWLTRTRLAYQDPERLELIKTEGDIEDAVIRG